MTTKGLTYADAGVNIDAADTVVSHIKAAVTNTHGPEVEPRGRGLNPVFDLSKIPGVSGLKGRLVAGADGVGTKVLLGIQLGMVETLGIDLVAMVVNDLLRQHAAPLFFLDYFATGKLEPGVGEEVILGIANGCHMAECALLGGEIAEMPGMYQAGHFDLAGFAVGLVHEDWGPPPEPVQVGDVVIGLPSSGVHSNGYSLVRKIVETANLKLDRLMPTDGGVFHSTRLGDLLMMPTRIYTRSVLPALRTRKVKGVAHITGGGLMEKPLTMLQDGLGIRFEADRIGTSPLFRLLQRAGNVSDAEMRRTFNCGWGMLLTVAPRDLDEVCEVLREHDEEPEVIGSVIWQLDNDTRVVFA
jgi:phosphoribosylformylglycinamidine cyclo-ligase